MKWILCLLILYVLRGTAITVLPTSDLASMLGTASNGDVFNLQDGNYLLSNIYLSANISLLGTGSGSVTIQCLSQLGISANGAITVRGITFSNCSTALEVRSTFDISLSTFDNNYNGINIVSGYGAIISTVFSNNEHGLVIWGSDVYVGFCSFSLNANGIVIKPPEATTLKIASSFFIGNLGTATEASAIELYGRSDTLNQNLFISNSTFSENSGAIPAIHTQYANAVTIASSTFSNNNGNGSVLIEHGSFASSSNSFISNNKPVPTTELYYVSSSTMTNDYYYGNSGGSFAIRFSITDIVGCNFDSNGGSISEASTIQVKNSFFTNNHAFYEGGGLLNEGSTSGTANLNFFNTVFKANNASERGGGLAIYGTATVTIQNCTIDGNTSPSGGGIYSDANVQITIISSEMNNNMATYGACVYSSQSVVLIINSTVSGNTAEGDSIIRGVGMESLIVRSTILSGSNESLLYCCNNVVTHNPNSGTCSYPSCSSSCAEATGCNCPYTYPSTGTDDCDCQGNYYGSQCESFNCTALNCSINSNCYGEDGFHNCSCNEGYEGDGYICNDIDECLDDSSCIGGICYNLPGSYACTCTDGYVGVFPNCSVGNECDNTTECSNFANNVCVSSNDNYTCVCAVGYEGDYWNCTDINECETLQPCGNFTCYNTEGSFNCSCPEGFEWNKVNCTDIDECARNASLCEYECINTVGSYNCSKCPSGIPYDETTDQCSLFCGDGLCSTINNETCVNCFRDCPYASCGQCGDGVCDGTETCANCYADCSSTCGKTCSSCVHGTCVSGVCDCSSGWTGPSCSSKRQTVSVAVQTTAPVVSLALSAMNTTKFSVGIRRIVEMNKYGHIVTDIELGENFDLVEAKEMENSLNKQWTFWANLTNLALVTVTFNQFVELESKYNFYGQTYYFSKDTLKLTVHIEDWPFTNIYNTLQVHLDNNATTTEPSTDNTTVVQNSYDAGGSLEWLQITLNGVSEYVQFIPYAVVDDRKRYIQFAHTSDGTVVAMLPSFYKYAVFDPDYTVLVSQDSKSSSNKNMIIVIAVVSCGVFGLAIIFGLTYYRMRGRINVCLGVKRDKRQVKTRLESTNSSSEMLAQTDVHTEL